MHIKIYGDDLAFVGGVNIPGMLGALLRDRSTLAVVLILTILLFAMGFAFVKPILIIAAILFFTFVGISILRNILSLF